jgi:broad specificity phosphatase PhoE
MTAFLLIRHAESTMNAAGLWQGQADPPLSEEGRRQAHALGAVLAAEKGLALDALVASDLRRAFETAAILGGPLGLTAEPVAALREWDVGAWSGMARDAIARRWPEEYRRVRGGDLAVRPGGGESRGQVGERVRGALAVLARRFPGGRVAVVTHLGVLRSLLPEIRIANTGRVWLAAGEITAPTPPTAALEEVL